MPEERHLTMASVLTRDTSVNITCFFHICICMHIHICCDFINNGERQREAWRETERGVVTCQHHFEVCLRWLRAEVQDWRLASKSVGSRSCQDNDESTMTASTHVAEFSPTPPK